MKKSEKLTDKDFSRMKKVANDRKKYISKGFYISYTLRVVLMFISIIVIGFIAYKCFDNSFSKSADNRLMYEEKSDIKYNMTLLPDNPYQTGELVPTEYYISDAIQSISTDFSYDMQLSDQVDVKYNYSVIAEIEVTNKDTGNVLSNPTDTLISNAEKQINDTNEINILQNVNLDYKTYNDIARSLDEHSINSEGKIELKMIINLEIKYPEFKETKTKIEEIKATIPLLSPEVKVNLDNQIDNTDMYKEEVESKLTSKTTLYVGIALLIIDVIFFLLVVSFMLRAKPKKSKYCILRDGLLRDYDSIIVNSRSIPKFNGINLIDCYSFQELLDAQKLLNKPIVYCEIVKNQKALFMIVNGEDAYKFTLKEVDLDY